MANLWQDVQYGWRMLWKNPGFTAIAVLTLTLGIGANTALFSVVNGVLLNPLPYPEPQQLVAVYGKTEQFAQSSIPYLNFLDWQKDNRTLASLAAFRSDDFNVTGQGEPERLRGFMISADLFHTLGVNPIIGRDFLREEDQPGAGPVALISEGLWKRKFGSANDVLGKTIILNGTGYTIVGVMPARFRPYGESPGVYVPIGQWNDPTFRDRRVGMGTNAVGRLKPGVTLAQARGDLDAVARNLAAAYPEANKGTGITVIPLKTDMVGNIQPFLLVLLAAVGCVLLIACANVANLMLARATGRTREFAIRQALGASRSRVIRQLLTESVLLSLVGGGLGLAMAAAGTGSILRVLPSALPRAEEIGLDSRVLLFTFGMSIVCGIFFGLAPAFKTRGLDLQETLKEGGRGASAARHRTQKIFVVAEMAIGLVLLVCAGLMIRSLTLLWKMDPGFNPHNALAFSISVPPNTGSQPPAIRNALHEMHHQLKSITGLEAVSLVGGALPMRGDSELPFWLEGQPRPTNANDMSFSLFYLVEPDYQQAMGIPLIRGRFLTQQDNEQSTPVVVIDEKLAHKYFPNQDPLGKYINLGLLDLKAQIVGVVGHIKHWGLDSEGHELVESQLYLPFFQLPDKFMPLVTGGIQLVARTHGTTAEITRAIRETIGRSNGQQVVYEIMTLDRIISDSLAARRFTMVLLGIFAALALILSSIGIYGVISYLVGERLHEIGIRMALGAQQKDVLQLVVGQGGRMALIGVGIGLAASLLFTRLMAKMLFGVSSHDPLTFAGVAMLLTATALAASYVPARRATKVDPVVALRYE